MSAYPLLDAAYAMRALRERREARALYFAELGHHLLRARLVLVEVRGIAGGDEREATPTPKAGS